MGTAVAIGIGTSILEPTFKFEAFDHSAIADSWHPQDCSTCHSDLVNSWNETWHSAIIGTKLVVNSTHVIRYSNNPFLPPTVWTIDEFAADGGCCMVTRWENTTQPGDTNASGSFWDYGITCAACHEEPGIINEDPVICAGCHIPGGNQYVAWTQSAHADSLDDLLASGQATSSCLHCMVGQGTYLDLTHVDPTDTRLTNIVCSTCHDPHDASINWNEESDSMGPNGHQLRTVTTNELCGSCHSQYEVLTNSSVISQHQTLSCTDCHGYRWHPEYNITDLFGNLVVVPAGFASINHTWEFSPFPEACGLCHGNENTTVWVTMQEYTGEVKDLIVLYETKLANVSAKVDEAFTTVGVDQTVLDEAYTLLDEAKNLVSDYDTAFHNPTLAQQKVQLALEKLDQAYNIAVVAIYEVLPSDTTSESITETTVTARTTTSTSTTTLPLITAWLNLTVVFPVLSMLTLRIRKKRR
jgi:hypothetical protein